MATSDAQSPTPRLHDVAAEFDAAVVAVMHFRVKQSYET